MAPMLRVSNVSKRFGSNPVIAGLSVDVAKGELLGVIGPNGAGKTTLFGLISGFTKLDAGSVILDGCDITSLSAYERCRAGIGRTFQVPRPFLGLTVLENVKVAARFGAGEKGRVATERAIHALANAQLLDRLDQSAESLTLLQRKQLEVARSVATNPKVLLLDEVAGGLTDVEVLQLVDFVRALHSAGTTIIWIEHLVHALASVAQRLLVLNFGERVADGAPAAVLADPNVRAIYMGTENDAAPLHA